LLRPRLFIPAPSTPHWIDFVDLELHRQHVTCANGCTSKCLVMCSSSAARPWKCGSSSSFLLYILP
jgi:hypothetical protein